MKPIYNVDKMDFLSPMRNLDWAENYWSYSKQDLRRFCKIF